MIKRVKIHGPGRHPWLASLLDRRTPKIAAVALANKLARKAARAVAKKSRGLVSRILRMGGTSL